MTAHRTGGDLTVETIDRSNTNPLCPDCDYRTRALDAYKSACDRCGTIVVDERRAARQVMAVFGARVDMEVYRDADR